MASGVGLCTQPVKSWFGSGPFCPSLFSEDEEAEGNTYLVSILSLVEARANWGFVSPCVSADSRAWAQRCFSGRQETPGEWEVVASNAGDDPGTPCSWQSGHCLAPSPCHLGLSTSRLLAWAEWGFQALSPSKEGTSLVITRTLCILVL